jgi:hypothetical protein
MIFRPRKPKQSQPCGMIWSLHLFLQFFLQVSPLRVKIQTGIF